MKCVILIALGILAGISACQKRGDLTQYYGSPEPVSLTIEGQTYSSAIGTTFWQVIMPDGTTGEVIGDAFAVITPAEPIVSTSPFTAILVLPIPVPPARLIYDLAPVSEDNKQPGSTAEYSRWQPQPEAQFPLPLLSRQAFNVATAPGLYVLSLFVEWEELGFANHGFLIQIKK